MNPRPIVAIARLNSRSPSKPIFKPKDESATTDTAFQEMSPLLRSEPAHDRVDLWVNHRM